MVIHMCRAIIFRHHFLLRIIVMTAFYDNAIVELGREMSGDITFQALPCCRSLVGALEKIVVVASQPQTRQRPSASERVPGMSTLHNESMTDSGIG
jgi:hypothetical protein